MDDVEPIEVNLPFQRLPWCACDPGTGESPTILKMLECKIAGGRCHPDYEKTHPAAEPAIPK
jgi:hypothetical protein